MGRVPGIALVALLGVVAERPAVPQETPTFPSEEQVVLLDLVARDKQGRQVADLTPGEVTVFEDGAACEVVLFRLVRSPLAGSAPAETSAPTPEATPPAEAVPIASPSRPNLVVLVFDSLPLVPARLARQGALDLISRDFPVDTWFAVFKIDRSMRQLQPFTSDPRGLASAIDFATTGDDARRLGDASLPLPLAVSPAAGSPLPVPGPPVGVTPSAAVAGIAASVGRRVAELASRVQTFDSLHGLLALSESLEPIRGRKTILYFAEARQGSRDATGEYEVTISAANRANVTIHTIDARGLDPRVPGGRTAFDEVLALTSAASESRPGFDPSLDRTYTMPTERPDTGGGPWLDSQPFQVDALSGSFLEHVAHDTGGLAIENTNDLGLGLSRVVEELGEYYEIAYHPANSVPDGRFRRISVKVSRPGVKVRTRAGYFATPASSPGVEAHELPLIAALGASPPPRDFEHESRILHFGVRGRERESVFMARVPMSDVRLTADDAAGVFRGRLSLLGMVQDEAGRSVARLSDDWRIEEPLERFDAVRGTAALFRRALTLPAGRYTLETAVRDGETGGLSVETSSFEIPEAPPGHLAVGSLSVVRRASAAEGAGQDPLSVAGVAIQPALATPKIFRSTPEIPLFLPIFPTLAGDPTELRLEVLRDGQPVADVSPTVPAPEPDGKIAWIGGLPATGLIPGRYEVVATVLQGDESAEARTAFEITARDGPAADAVVPPVPEDLVPVLDRAARYVLDYERTFDDIAAEESYTQWSSNTRNTARTSAREIALTCSVSACRRQTKAEVVFVRLAGSVPWGTFRDVYEVDGQEVNDREGRLVELFSTSSPAGATQRARAILNESARYNIGPAIRTINFPTLSLMFLHPRNQARFAWTRGGTRRFGNVEAVEVDFEEVSRPTIVDQNGHGDLPAEGRFWIDPARGTVVRAETKFTFEGRRARARVATQYRPEPRLAMWVPSEMREQYDDLPGTPDPVFHASSEAIARYSNFRRFTVAVEEGEVALAPE